MMTRVLPAETSRVEPISIYEDNYMLFGYDDVSLNKGAVYKFQLSVKIITFVEGVFIGYTQRSFMDVLADSFPFYDHSFSPELFYRPPSFRSERIEFIQGGIRHESNGNDSEQSRGWNRAYVEASFLWGKFFLRPSIWYAFLVEDTRDILDIYGWGQAVVGYRSSEQIVVSLRARVGQHLDKGSLMLDFSLPMALFNQRAPELYHSSLWLQTWYGQGETLLGVDEGNFAVAAGIGFRPISAKNRLRVTQEALPK